jgi:hypothetical protein
MYLKNLLEIKLASEDQFGFTFLMELKITKKKPIVKIM